jgi:hypothetical protein
MALRLLRKATKEPALGYASLEYQARFPPEGGLAFL